MLEAVAPFLSRRGTVFKGPESLLILKRLNCGLFYGYTQVGKFLTVYPRDDDDACALAQELDRLTRNFGGPAVPFESPVSQGSSVYTRFGAFRATPESGAADVVRGPDGATIPDRRDSNPDWAQHPNGLIQDHSPRTRGPLATSYRAYQAVSQRGKGGVYRALDLTVQPARLCALKEGRTFGEVDIDGSDGRSRLAQELQVLSDLEDHPVQAPRVYDHFVEGGHLYTVLEWIEGESLAEMVQPSNGQRPIDDAMRLASQCALLLSRLHRRGWSWRDMKPANLILSAGRLRPVDFEGSTRLGSVVTSPWGSSGLPSARMEIDWRGINCTGSLRIRCHRAPDLHQYPSVL